MGGPLSVGEDGVVDTSVSAVPGEEADSEAGWVSLSLSGARDD